MSARNASRWAVLTLLLVVGCHRMADELPSVQGTVSYRGKPLTGGTIVFTPDAERGGSGPFAVGEIGRDGHYTLKTEGRAGAVVGWHRVTIAPLAPNDGGPSSCALPCHYRDPERSGQSCEVKLGESNTFDLNLE